MINPSPQALATRAVHGGAEPHRPTGARVTPIFQTNGFVFDDQQHGADIFAMRRAGFSYSRGSNPTVAALERRIASLEGGTAGVAVASGQAAWLVALLALCATGEEYVGSSQVFGGSLGLMKRLDKRLNVKCAFAEPTPESIAAAITPRTAPSSSRPSLNPTGEVVDLDGIAEVAKAHKLPFIVDSTLASPALLRPIEHGADIVIHSASKFLVGNGTAIGGSSSMPALSRGEATSASRSSRSPGKISRISCLRSAIRKMPSRPPAACSACASSAPACRRRPPSSSSPASRRFP